MQKYCKALGHPERSVPIVHIAGTNGKGTAATKIARALEATGLKVGLYTSPHIVCFCERISINGEFIPRPLVVRGITQLRHLVEELGGIPFFFELATLLAFDYFRRQSVDIAVIEVGMGGIIDSTNLVTPILSVITSIDFDHTDTLGSTLDEIAATKAGIIKKGVPVVLGPEVNYHPVMQRAEQCKAEVHQAKSIPDIVYQSLRVLQAHFPISDEAIKIGMSASTPCRFEVIYGNDGRPEIIFDVAHNPSALLHLFGKIEKTFPEARIHVLFGMSIEKNIDQSTSIIAGKADRIHLYPSDNKRLCSAEHLLQMLCEKGFEAVSIGGFEEALEEAADKEAILVVTGSFYVVGELLKSSRTSLSVG